MTSQDKLIAYFVETSGITSPTLMAETLGVPVETARSWLKRIRSKGSNQTGEIRPGGEIRPVRSDQGGEIRPVPRARISYTGEPKGSLFSPSEKRKQSDDMRAALTGEIEKVVWSDDERLTIACPIEYRDQLALFDGDEKRLRLALDQAAGYIQPNSNRPLLVQVRSQLAQQAARAREQDRRYQMAKIQKPAEPSDAFRGIL